MIAVCCLCRIKVKDESGWRMSTREEFDAAELECKNHGYCLECYDITMEDVYELRRKRELNA